MTTWINDFLERNPEMSRRPVLLRVETATHFVLAPGLARALITGAAQYFRRGGRWQPFDLTLREDSSGLLGAEGLPVHIQTDGLVRIEGKRYQQQTLSVGTLSAGRIYKTG